MINIYRASAGAGKTHKLTGEYLKLLFKKPLAYKHILAVTFTNKATDEMKQRILQELYYLSLPDKKSDYLSELMQLYGKEEAWVRGDARRILVALLNDYSSFSVSTIDKFFQTVMRAFARELGKIATYNVELDRDSVLANAIDRMFSELDRPENDSLLKWLIEYSLDAVDAGDSWNIRKEIFNLAKELFSEDFKLKKKGFEEHGLERDKILLLKSRERELIVCFEKEVRLLGAEGLECMDRYAISPSDFKGGSRSVFHYFKTLANPVYGSGVVPPKDSFIALYDCMDVWYSGKTVPAAVAQAYDGGLNEIIGKVISYFQVHYRRYATARVILENTNALGILDDIYRRVLEYCKEKNIMLLSESTELLNRIIDGSDTPFVYEKLGTRIDNFMLDEFQDTSVLQWRNFYPLLQNSQAMDHDNLIVGDVKQSIYRWRGSDWKILNSGLAQEFRPDEITAYSLDCNWRSGKNIVEFNNGFFKYCAQVVQDVYRQSGGDATDSELIGQVYANFEQSVPVSGKADGHDGYLEVNFINEMEDSFETDVLRLLPDRIKDLLENGLNMRDIAVLVRKREQGRNVAQTLVDAGFDVISNDSLFVCSSVAVQKVVNILRELENPDNPALKIYRHFSQAGEVQGGGSGVDNLQSGTNSVRLMEEADLPEHLAGMSLYQMCEEIIRCYLNSEEKEDLAFLQAFLDSVLEYTNREGTNLSGFLKWWDDCGQIRTISAPEDQNAITVITIHKSKGLGFKCVIIPFFKEKLDHTGGRLWCTMYDEPPVPVVYNSALVDTAFSGDYYHEKLYTFVDNLNTAYVAFTRPKDELIIYAQAPKMKKDGTFSVTSVSDVLYMYYNQPVERITIGELSVSAKNVSATGKEILTAVFTDPLDDSRTKTSLNSGSINEGASIREYGIAMHYVFSLITTQADIAGAAAKAFADGVCECSADELVTMVMNALSSVEQYGWFGGDYMVLNECDIIKPDGNVARPDRVLIKDGCAIVVDYKFGELSGEDASGRKYVRQVREYMELLAQIGYTDVKGYVWYIKSGEVVGC